MDYESGLVKIRTMKADGDLQIINGYGDFGFRINGRQNMGSVFIAPRQSQIWMPPTLGALTASVFSELFSDEIPPLLLLGVGTAPAQQLLNLANELRQCGVGLEVMSTPAACRTWNVLISEGRDARAALYAVA